MCRLVAWLGPARPLASLVTQGSHPLLVQSWAAREMRGTVNADGYGAGWYLPEDSRPCTYHCAAPMWADPNLDSLGRTVVSHCAVAAVRNATPGMPYGMADTPPYADESTVFAHNGHVGHFRTRMLRRLRDELSDATYTAVRGGTDSEHVYALVRERLAAGDPLTAALAAALTTVGAWATELGVPALLTTVLTDGRSLVASRAGVRDTPPTLYVLAPGTDPHGGVLLASERLDENPGWRAVPAGSLLTVGPDGVVHTQDLVL